MVFYTEDFEEQAAEHGWVTGSKRGIRSAGDDSHNLLRAHVDKIMDSHAQQQINDGDAAGGVMKRPAAGVKRAAIMDGSTDGSNSKLAAITNGDDDVPKPKPKGKAKATAKAGSKLDGDDLENSIAEQNKAIDQALNNAIKAVDSSDVFAICVFANMFSASI